ncbi:MAG: glycosyl hydrolase, partial [Candidatus Angelobacter sp.]
MWRTLSACRAHTRVGACCAILAFCLAAQGAGIEALHKEFVHPPADAKIMMRWWWFGPAVTKSEMQRELLEMKDAGIGGVELQSVYPLALDDPQLEFHTVPYLSNAFLQDVGFAATAARELGLRFDVTLGSGWPFGGPYVPVTQAAGKLRVVSVSPQSGENEVLVPSISLGERLLAAFLTEPRQPARMLDLNSIRAGRLNIGPFDGSPSVVFFISSRTGMMVKRAAVGAEGFVADHFDRFAIENYLQAVGDPLLTAFGKNPPNSAFSDSLEVYGSDWTSDLLQEFQKRRGYDLAPLLPDLISDVGPHTEAVRHDWGETLTELVDERYLTPIREWAKEHGTLFRSQTYGIPAVSLSSNRLVDLP